MSWQPPQGQPVGSTPSGWTPTDTTGGPWYRNRAFIYVGLGIIVVVGGIIAGLSEDDESSPPSRAAPAARELIQGECPSLAACRIEVDLDGPTYRFALLPEATNAGMRSLGIWAIETGCLEEVDFSRMEQTRALDGMVASANGRSTWTYHPDDGLIVVCS